MSPAPQTFLLTVTKQGTGSGTVTSNPAGINCGNDCSQNYNAGTVVTLFAAPAQGSIFAGWSGACSGTGNCIVTMNSNKNVIATFNLNQTNQTNLPDLIILSQSINVANNQTNQTNYTVTITAYVKNQGNANAGASTTRFLVSGVGGQQLASTPSIPAGQYVAVSRTYSLSQGAYTLTNNADWNNVIAESNENNNAAVTNFNVPS